MKFYIKQLIRFIQERISKSNKMIFKLLKLVLFTFENYQKSRSDLWTSTLTFYSLLTIVPVVAIGFVITKGFGVELILTQELHRHFFIQGEILDQILVFSHQALDNAKGELIAGTGVVFLLWSAIRIFSVIEKAFNEIWKVEESRSFVRKLTDYLALVFLFPLIMVLSNGLVAILKLFIIKLDLSVFNILLTIFPQTLLVIFFTLTYLIIPNTKVKLSTAFIAGLFSGVVFQISQWCFLYIQVNLLNYNAIYGSFSLIPVFILWQKMVWFIVLLGAHLSFIIQNSYKYSYTIKEINLTFASKRNLALLCLYYHIKSYEKNLPPLSTRTLAHTLGVSIGVTQDILNILVKSSFIVEVVSSSESRKYKISKNIEDLSIEYILKKLSNIGYSQNVGKESQKVLDDILKAIKNKNFELLLKDIKCDESYLTRMKEPPKKKIKVPNLKFRFKYKK